MPLQTRQPRDHADAGDSSALPGVDSLFLPAVFRSVLIDTAAIRDQAIRPTRTIDQSEIASQTAGSPEAEFRALRPYANAAGPEIASGFPELRLRDKPQRDAGRDGDEDAMAVNGGLQPRIVEIGIKGDSLLRHTPSETGDAPAPVLGIDLSRFTAPLSWPSSPVAPESPRAPDQPGMGAVAGPTDSGGPLDQNPENGMDSLALRDYQGYMLAAPGLLDSRLGQTQARASAPPPDGFEADWPLTIQTSGQRAPTGTGDDADRGDGSQAFEPRSEIGFRGGDSLEQLEARLARAADRIEQAADRIAASGQPFRNPVSRPFRGRVDS